MPAKNTNDTAEGFVGSIFKFSISTYVNFGVYGLSILLLNFLVKDDVVYGDIQVFIKTVTLLMTIGILGLDQALIRFYNEPPARLSGEGLFRVCLYISGGVLVAGGVVCSLFFPNQLRNLFEFEGAGAETIPLLFLGAFFYMIARYFNVLYRMEQNIRLYTVQSILMNFFLQLFYLVGAFFPGQGLAMMLCSVLGLGAFSTIFCFWRAGTVRPRRGEVSREALKTVLPYGLMYAPTTIFIRLNEVFASLYLGQAAGLAARGVYFRGLTLSNIVTTVQAGFASFWGAYMFANYKTQQPRIQKVHDFLNFIILVFFALLVGFEDILFWVLASYADAQPVFPLMMLAAVFTILCETTVYGIAIAKRPIFDTLGFGVSLLCNVLLCVLLVPGWGLVGAGVALALANFAMYLFRTLFGQYFYRTIRYPGKTALALALAFALTAAGTLWHDRFVLKLACCTAAILIYCLMYREELVRCAGLARDILTMLRNRYFRR